MNEGPLVLCAVSLDAGMEEVLSHATMLAETCMAHLVVLHVSERQLARLVGEHEIDLASSRALRIRIAELMPDAAEDVIVRHGAPAAVILEEAARLRPDYLVLGAPWRGAGAVFSAIVRAAPCAIVAVPMRPSFGDAA